MNRNRFDEIMKYTNCYDSEDAEEGDRCAKIRALAEKLYEHFMKYQPSKKKTDADESKLPHFGSYGASIKQAMHQKPVTYKV